MRRFIIFVASGIWLALLLTVVSCSKKHFPTVENRQRDSVRVEYRERVVRDTAYVDVPREVERIVTRDTVSTLSNRYASSTASVSSGYLTHTLESKPQRIAVPYYVQVRDTVIVKDHMGEEFRTEYINVLTGFQRFEIRAFWVLAVLLLIVVAWKIYRLLRP